MMPTRMTPILEKRMMMKKKRKKRVKQRLVRR